jgi:hypothetical protein
MKVNYETKVQVVKTLLGRRKIFDGTDSRFAKTWGLPGSLWSTLKTAYNSADGLNGKLKDTKWMQLARALGVVGSARKWNTVKTEVFQTIEEEVLFCKAHSKSRIFVDDCAIGKTYTAKYLAATLPNAFYVDCSQCKTHPQFLRALALAIGVDHKGVLQDVADGIRFCLRSLEQPIVILDEAGDLNAAAFLDLKSLWNATEGVCGWYMMGADGLRAKIDRGYNNKRLGYAELFSRFSESYSSVVPSGREARKDFYRTLITQVISANMTEGQEAELEGIVKRCLVDDSMGRLGGLRRAESLLILHSNTVETEVEA